MIPHTSFNTELSDRTLWYDGDSSFNSDNLMDIVSNYNIKYVDKITDLVKQYNKNVGTDQQISIKTSCSPLKYEWNIPQEYKKLDIIEYVSNKHMAILNKLKDNSQEARDLRIAQELVLYMQYNLSDVLRTIIYVINTLSVNDIVWGVGRGSSVSSYVLYIIGVHDVDSFHYDLDITDFLHN